MSRVYMQVFYFTLYSILRFFAVFKLFLILLFQMEKKHAQIYSHNRFTVYFKVVLLYMYFLFNVYP